jgi:GTP-binding nuclear protein Ran
MLTHSQTSSIQTSSIQAPSIQTSFEKKVVLVGDGGVGKSAYVKKLFTGDFHKTYFATLGVEVYPIKCNEKKFTFWDTAGQDKFGGLKDGYYINADYGIIMCSDFKITNRSIKGWFEDLRRINPGIKVILLNNKCDVPHELSEKTLKFLEKNEIEKFDISTKNMTVEELQKPLEVFV